MTRRVFNTTIKLQRYKNIFIAAFIIYLVYLIYLTFFAQLYGRTIIHRSVNMIPFKTVIHYMMTSNSPKIVLINIAGNIAAFVPMGFLPPLVSDKLTKFSKVILLILLATVTIEMLQFAFGVGVTDIDDVILNLLGGILGFMVNRILVKVYMKINRLALKEKQHEHHD